VAMALRASADMRIRGIEREDQGEPNGGHAATSWSSELAPASFAVAVHGGRNREQAIDAYKDQQESPEMLRLT
jgi:hypothetical protein